MAKKKDFPVLSGWNSKTDYELDFLRLENQRLKEQLDTQSTKMTPEMENDIASLVKISLKMRALLEACRSHTLPMELAKEIDKVLKEIENYN
jgi:hypothetical protein